MRSQFGTSVSFVSPDARCFSGVKCNFDWLLSDEEKSADVSPRREQPQVTTAQTLDFMHNHDEERTLLGCEEKFDVAMTTSHQLHDDSANTPSILACKPFESQSMPEIGQPDRRLPLRRAKSFSNPSEAHKKLKGVEEQSRQVPHHAFKAIKKSKRRFRSVLRVINK